MGENLGKGSRIHSSVDDRNFGRVSTGSDAQVFCGPTDGEVGVLVQPKDRRALVQNVVEILQNPELANRLGRAGRERVLREFTWQQQGEKFSQLVQEVLEEMRPQIDST